jgi:hypothetical protein
MGADRSIFHLRNGATKKRKAMMVGGGDALGS